MKEAKKSISSSSTSIQSGDGSRSYVKLDGVWCALIDSFANCMRTTENKQERCELEETHFSPLFSEDDDAKS